MKRFIGLFLLAATLFASASNAQEVYKTETIVGIGATLEKLVDGSVQVIGLIPNAPAEQSGLAVGDLILEVKSLPTSSVVSVLNLPLVDVVALIRGPIGVPVEILFRRGTGADTVVSIVREKFEVPDEE